MTEPLPYRLLYVDDEPNNLLAFRAVFRRFYDVLTAHSASEATALLAENPVDLIVSDHRMPHMTGVEFFEQIKETYPDTVRIILTGYSDLQAIVDAINKGNVYYYATKPWKVDELKVVIDNALESHALRLRNRQLEQERNELLLRAVKREKEQVLSQYEALRNQVNPHFLFNSLNTLAALITTDPPQALQFTRQFSKVYRTLLEWGNEPLVSLRQELELTQAFVFLQQMRFGQNLTCTFAIPDALQRHCLPPFAMQLLIENAIKHNIISNEKPLWIRVFVQDGRLWVENKFQKWGSVEESTGTGLRNLRARYALITPDEVLIRANETSFCVSLPLISEA